MSFASSSSTREPGLDFDRAIALPEHSPTPRFVVANMNSWNFSKSAFVDSHASSDGRNASIVSIESRPKTSHGITSHGILNRPKRQSFSRPLTSEGHKGDSIPPPPRLPMDFLPRSDSVTPNATPIGLALGSPSVPNHSTLDFNLNGPASAPFEPTDTPFTPSGAPKSPTPTQPPEREQPAKSKRWISMGNLFRKKSSAAPPAPPVESPKPAKLTRKSQDSGSGSRRRSLSRRRSFGSGLRSKPDSEELPPMPPKLDLEHVRSKDSFARPGTSSKGSSIRPNTGSKDSVARPATGSKEDAAISTPKLELPREEDALDRPTLDIDIPQTKLDRYSVMFSDVLSQPFLPEKPPLQLPQASEPIKSTTLELPSSSTGKAPQGSPRALSPMSRRPLPPPSKAPSQPPPPLQASPSYEKRTVPVRKPAPSQDPSLQRRRKPDMEKLSPLNMHRISQSPMFHHEPSSATSASSIRTAPLPGAFPAPPSPMPQSAPAVTIEKSPSRTPSISKPSGYSLFPKTDSSPPLPSSSSFVSVDREPELRPTQSRENFTAPVEDSKPLRSSSVFPAEDRADATSPRPLSARPTLYPPSPPLSAAASPSVATTHTLASPSFRSARSSVYSSRAGSVHTNDESDFPSGVEINEQGNTATTIGAFDLPGLLSPPHTSEIPTGHFMDDQESVGTPSRSSAVGDSPLLGMARSVSLSYRHEKPRFLKPSSHAQEDSDDSSTGKDSMHEARASARTPTFVHVDESELFEDEDSWIRRRSMWGVMEDA